MTGSLAYRQNEAAILRGDVPEKYLRILPHIPPGRILEIGAAEGVLSLLLASRGNHVIGLEKSRERHGNSLRLRELWAIRELNRARQKNPLRPQTYIDKAELICGDIRERFDLLRDVDTLVAVRMIYYLRGDIDAVFARIAEKVPNVVLCGNRGRAKRYHEGRPDQPLGEFNLYASAEGMRAVLQRHGYEIAGEVTDGDAIVVGRK